LGDFLIFIGAFNLLEQLAGVKALCLVGAGCRNDFLFYDFQSEVNPGLSKLLGSNYLAAAADHELVSKYYLLNGDFRSHPPGSGEKKSRETSVPREITLINR